METIEVARVEVGDDVWLKARAFVGDDGSIRVEDRRGTLISVISGPFTRMPAGSDGVERWETIGATVERMTTCGCGGTSRYLKLDSGDLLMVPA